MPTEPEAPPPSSCPVDPSARAAWLEAAAQSRDPPQIPHPLPPTSTSTSQPPPTPRLLKNRPLASDRVISTIPRAELSPTTTTPNPTSAPSTTTPNPASTLSPNAQNSPQISSTGKWIYPSERMFFDALSRKNRTPDPTDMPLVVPIHNAVNERAWSLIKGWELGTEKGRRMNEGCGGPRLRSFRGESGRLTPRARVYSWLGYEKPFDRHDWVVERCVDWGAGEGRDGVVEARGQVVEEGVREVEYVIDFYRGRGGAGNFFLDVRPKLNCWEGWRMRAMRFLGMG